MRNPKDQSQGFNNNGRFRKTEWKNIDKNFRKNIITFSPELKK